MFPGNSFLFGQLILGFIGWNVASPPPVSVVGVGEGVRVPCPLAAARGASVQWMHNGHPVLLEGGRAWEVSPEGVASLSISSARLLDSGEWGCRDISKGGEEVRVLTLRVTSAPHLELEGRRLLHRATVTVKEPHTLHLHCVLTGTDAPPTPHIHWFMGDANVTSSSELFVESEGGVTTSRSILQLNATREVHGREVVCSAHHDTWRQGAAAVSVSLNVLYEPSFSISRDPGFGLPLVAGMRVTLVCLVDANPPSSPLWVRDDPPPQQQQEEKEDQGEEGDQGEEEGQMQFDPVSEEDSGWYRCTTENEAFGFFASFGYFLHVRAADPSSDDVTLPPPPQSSSGSAACIPDGRPEVSALGDRFSSGVAGAGALLSGRLCSPLPPRRIFWILGRHTVVRPGDKLRHYVAHKPTEEEGEEGCWRVVLEVVRLSLDDSGEVVLVATNEKGAADVTFLLNVTHSAQLSAAASTPDTGVFGACAVMVLLLWLLRWTLDNR